MYVLFVIELRGRRVHFADMTREPDDACLGLIAHRRSQ